MKKIHVLISVLLFSLTSCNLEDKFENTINRTAASIRQDATERIIIEAIDLARDGNIIEEFNIDTSEIIDRINASTNGLIDIDDISLDDLEIRLIEGSEQANFDFIDALSLTLSTIDSVEPVTIDFGTIEKGATSFTLPEDVETSILRLIEESDEDELTVIMNLVTNANIEDDIELELISVLLAALGFDS